MIAVHGRFSLISFSLSTSSFFFLTPLTPHAMMIGPSLIRSLIPIATSSILSSTSRLPGHLVASPVLEGGHGLGSCLLASLALRCRGDECHDIDLDPVDPCPSPYPCKDQFLYGGSSSRQKLWFVLTSWLMDRTPTTRHAAEAGHLFKGRVASTTLVFPVRSSSRRSVRPRLCFLKRHDAFAVCLGTVQELHPRSAEERREVSRDDA